MNLPIINAPAIETGTFNRYWVTNLTITMSNRKVMARLQQYDGAHLLANKDKMIVGDCNVDTDLNNLVNGAVSLMQSKAGRIDVPKFINCIANNPDRPVNAVAVFSNGVGQRDTVFVINDLFKVAETDFQVAQIFGGIIAWVAGKA